MRLFYTLAVLVFLQSCSVYMAAKQENRKNLTILQEGADRSSIIGALGSPSSTDTSSKNKIDYFNFTQGYSTSTKTMRAVTHGLLDVVTIGVWEVVGTPVEAGFDGYKVIAEIEYDKNNKAKTIKLFKDGTPAKIYGSGDLLTEEELERYKNTSTKIRPNKSN